MLGGFAVWKDAYISTMLPGLRYVPSLGDWGLVDNVVSPKFVFQLNLTDVIVTAVDPDTDATTFTTIWLFAGGVPYASTL